jgi:hypothetical protein
VIGTGLEITSADLYRVYRLWAVGNGDWPMNNNAFGRKLTKKGFKRRKVRGERGWEGLALRETIQDSLAWEVAAMDLPRRSALPPGRTR